MANPNGLDTNRTKAGGAHSAGNEPSRTGRFSEADLEILRNDLMQSGLDSWQAAQTIATFLAGRGYGVSSNAALSAVERIERVGFSMESMQSELEKLAMVM